MNRNLPRERAVNFTRQANPMPHQTNPMPTRTRPLERASTAWGFNRNVDKKAMQEYAHRRAIYQEANANPSQRRRLRQIGPNRFVDEKGNEFMRAGFKPRPVARRF